MQRVYLDTQQYRYLVEPRPGLGCSLELLLAAVSDGEVEVVGSLEIIQEFTPIAQGHHRAYLEQLELFTRLVGRRILHPTNERHLLEQRHGGLLGEGDRYLPRDRRRQILRGGRVRSEAVAVAEEAARGKETYAATERKMRAAFKEMAAEAGERVTLHTMKRWLAKDADLDEWNREIVEEGVRKGLYELAPDTAMGLETFPTSWLMNSYRAARTVFTVGEGRKIKPSDLADAHHVACGAYFDVLVTDDNDLLDALDLLGARLPFTWMRGAEFDEQLVALV